MFNSVINVLYYSVPLTEMTENKAMSQKPKRAKPTASNGASTATNCHKKKRGKFITILSWFPGPKRATSKWHLESPNTSVEMAFGK